MNSIDIFVQNYFALTRTALLTEWMYILSNLFNVSAYSVSLFIFVTAIVFLVRGKSFAILFCSSIIFTSMLVYLLKVYFNVARPEDFVVLAFGQSFPSFHATIATVFFIMLMFIFDGYLNSFLRLVFNLFSVVLIFAVGFSRVYLGAHWVSDVFFGIILGALVSYFFIILFRHFMHSVMTVHPDTSMLK